MPRKTNHYLDHDTNEYWLRCFFCGDSTRDKSKAHFSINLTTGLYHCHRCGEGGRYSPYHIARLTGVVLTTLGPPDQTMPKKEVDISMAAEMLLDGPGSTRHSALARYHITTRTHDLVDAFMSRSPAGIVRGVHLRRPGWSRNVGERRLGFPGNSLWWSPSTPRRIVEGPYDVLADNDICTFGMPTVRQLSQLSAHSLIFCPDGDVWPNEALLGRYLATITHWPLKVVGFEILEKDQDPDDVPVRKRWLVRVDTPTATRRQDRLKHLLHQLSNAKVEGAEALLQGQPTLIEEIEQQWQQMEARKLRESRW